jgi:hypothetical protein
MIVAAIAETAVTAFTVAQTAAAFAINFAVSQIVTRVFAEDPQGSQDNGVRQQVPPSSTNAIPVVYGDAYMGGTFVDAVLTTDQKAMYYVMAVSSISPDGQFTFDTTSFYYGDRLITFDGTDLTKVISLTDEAGNVDTKISGNLYINLYKSSASGTITPLNSSSAPSTVMGGSDIAVGQRWAASNRQMNGLAFAIIKLNYNQDAGTTSLSPITFKVSHYLNGAGCAKPGDVWYDYITNKVYGGAVGWLPDGTFSSSFVDAASAAVLNTYSDELITFNNSSGVPSTQPRYRINGVLDAGQTVLSNIDKIMSCCDSWMTYNSALGKWSVVVNKAETAAYSFDDNNIIGDIRVSATDITSSINQVEAKFPFKENRDQPSFVQLATPTALLYPNEPVNKYSITYDLVNESVQASYLANRLLEQAREDLIVSFNTTYYGIQVDAGDVISLTNSAYGWTNKLFRVIKVNEASLPDGSLGAKLELSEYNAAVYDNYDITAFTPAPNSGLPSAVYFSALSAPTVTASNPTSAIPNFNVSVAIPAIGRVTKGDLFYTTVAIPSPSDWKLLSSASTVDGVPVTPSTTYVFANQVLPTGASPSATYYFSYVVGNDLSTSPRSPISAAFTWTPVAGTGPTGPTGSLGPTGATGSGTPGLIGLSSLTAYRVQSQSTAAPATPSNTTGPTAPSGWSLTAPTVAVGDVLWYSFGQYNANVTTVEGIPANQTQWGTPTAASVFQDIRSDNWNGGTPPTTPPYAPLGSLGYYIQRSTGNVYLDSVYGRGIAQFDGANPVAGGYNAAILANASLGQNIGVQAFTNNSFLSSGAIRAFNQGSGVGNAIYAFHSGSGYGILAQSSSGSGVLGTGTTGVIGNGTVGVQGNGGGSGGIGVQAQDTGGGIGLDVVGSMRINNSSLVANLNADLLDGYHAGAFATAALGTAAYAANRLNGSTSGILQFVSGSTSGASTATFSGTTKPGSSSTNSWITITIDGTTFYIPVWT